MHGSISRGMRLAPLGVVAAAAVGLLAGVAFDQPAHAQRNPFKTHHQLAFVNETPYTVLEFWVTDGKKDGYDVDFLAALDVQPGKYSTQDFMIPVDKPCLMTVEIGYFDTKLNKKQYVNFKNQNICIGQRFVLGYTQADDNFSLSIG